MSGSLPLVKRERYGVAQLPRSSRARHRGIASATLNGIAVDPPAIPLQDDDGEYEVSIVLGIAVGEVLWGSPSLGRGFRRPLPLKVQAVHQFPEVTRTETDRYSPLERLDGRLRYFRDSRQKIGDIREIAVVLVLLVVRQD
jgi:hypothetical protein